MEKKDWEKIYKEKGDLRFAVLPKIRRAAGVFKKKGYKKILDLGCGTGKHSIFLAKRGFSVYATDISPSGIEILVIQLFDCCHEFNIGWKLPIIIVDITRI